LYIDSLLGFGEDQLHFSFFPGAHFPQGGALLRNVALGDVITRQNISHSNHVLNGLLRNYFVVRETG